MSFRNLSPKDVDALKRACAGDQATPGIIEAICSSESPGEVRKVCRYVACCVSVLAFANWNLSLEDTYSSSCPTENSGQTTYSVHIRVLLRLLKSQNLQNTIFEYSVPDHMVPSGQ